MAPNPSRGRPPPHPKISGQKSLGLGSFLLRLSVYCPYSVAPLKLSPSFPNDAFQINGVSQSGVPRGWSGSCFKVPDPRGTTISPRKYASQRALRGSLRGLCRVSPTVLRGSAGVRGIFRGSQRALRDRLTSRDKNCLPTVSRQFLTRNYPRPNCLLKCLTNCLSPTREGSLSSFKINPAVRVIARQVRDKNYLAAIGFVSGGSDPLLVILGNCWILK